MLRGKGTLPLSRPEARPATRPWSGCCRVPASSGKNRAVTRVGFLFNHYATHQVPHAAPYAFELSRRHPEIEVTIAASSDAELASAAKIGDLYPGHRCILRRLRPAWWYGPFDPVVSRFAFARKDRILADNLDFFAGLDALVAPERHCRRLRTKHRLARPKLIHTRHGAGDREGTSDADDGIVRPRAASRPEVRRSVQQAGLCAPRPIRDHRLAEVRGRAGPQSGPAPLFRQRQPGRRLQPALRSAGRIVGPDGALRSGLLRREPAVQPHLRAAPRPVQAALAAPRQRYRTSTAARRIS